MSKRYVVQKVQVFELVKRIAPRSELGKVLEAILGDSESAETSLNEVRETGVNTKLLEKMGVDDLDMIRIKVVEEEDE